MNMTTLALNLIASNGAEVEWSRTLMIAWLVIVFALSVIELFWLKRFRRFGLIAWRPSLHRTPAREN